MVASVSLKLAAVPDGTQLQANIKLLNDIPQALRPALNARVARDLAAAGVPNTYTLLHVATSPETHVQLRAGQSVLRSGHAGFLTPMQAALLPGLIAVAALVLAGPLAHEVGAPQAALILGLGLLALNRLGPSLGAAVGHGAPSGAGVAVELSRPLVIRPRVHGLHLPLRLALRGVELDAKGAPKVYGTLRLAGIFELEVAYLQAAALALTGWRPPNFPAPDGLQGAFERTAGLEVMLAGSASNAPHGGPKLVVRPGSSLTFDLDSDDRAPLTTHVDGRLNLDLRPLSGRSQPLSVDFTADVAARATPLEGLTFAWSAVAIALGRRSGGGQGDALSWRTGARDGFVDVDLMADFASGSLAPMQEQLVGMMGANAALLPIAVGTSWSLEKSIPVAQLAPLVNRVELFLGRTPSFGVAVDDAARLAAVAAKA